MNSDNITLAEEVFRTWKRGKARRRFKSLLPKREGSEPYAKGDVRDPLPASSIVSDVVSLNGWTVELENWKVVDSWEQIVGETTASRTRVVDFVNHTLSVECDSTAWATQLRSIRAEIVKKIKEEFPQSKIEEINFFVTGIPTWRHGPRVVRGQGPRDTYK